MSCRLVKDLGHQLERHVERPRAGEIARKNGVGAGQPHITHAAMEVADVVDAEHQPLGCLDDVLWQQPQIGVAEAFADHAPIPSPAPGSAQRSQSIRKWSARAATKGRLATHRSIPANSASARGLLANSGSR